MEKEEEKTGSEGGGEEGNDMENTATLKSPWPDEKVNPEPASVGLALHFGKPGHGGKGGERFVSSGFGVVFVKSHHRAQPKEKGAQTQGLFSVRLGVDSEQGEFLKKDQGARPHPSPLADAPQKDLETREKKLK